MRISDWSSDVCSSDLVDRGHGVGRELDIDHRAGDGHDAAVLQGGGALGHGHVRSPGSKGGRATGGRRGRHGCRRGRIRSKRRSEEHTSELQSLMRISYAVFCLKKKNKTKQTTKIH